MPGALFHGEIVNTNRILYTPSNFAKTSLLHVQEVGSLQAQKQHISKRTRLDSYLFFIVNSGSGTLTYDNEHFSLSAGDCVFIDCNKSYSHETSEELWSLSWVHFNGPTVSEIYQKYLQRGGSPIFRPDNFNKYPMLLSEIYTIVSSESYVRDMQINAILSHLLTYLMEDCWQEDVSKSSSKRTSLYDLKSYLDTNYYKKISLDELAERYYINKFYMTRIFKEQFGTSINNYLLTLRITKAKQSLRFTDKTTEEIGLECGIGSSYYFSRVFHKVEGMSPTEYRRQWRN